MDAALQEVLCPFEQTCILIGSREDGEQRGVCAQVAHQPPGKQDVVLSRLAAGHADQGVYGGRLRAGYQQKVVLAFL